LISKDPKHDFQLWLVEIGYTEDGNKYVKWKIKWFDENGKEIKEK